MKQGKGLGQHETCHPAEHIVMMVMITVITNTRQLQAFCHAKCGLETVTETRLAAGIVGEKDEFTDERVSDIPRANCFSRN